MKLVGSLRARLGLDKKPFDKNLKSAKSGAKKFGSAMKKIGSIIAGAFAIKIIAQWGKATLNAYKEQRSAELKLATIMRDRMKLGKDAFKRIAKQTSEYQKQGIIGDEIQLAGVQQLATFVKQEKALSNMIPAMNNLLAQQKGYNAQAGDAVNIANMMGRVLTGQVSALSRVGISFTEAQKQTLKFGTELEKTATLSEIITDNVGNMNEELAKTDLGKIQTFRNLWGDLKEWIGGKIVPGLAKVASLFSKLITPKASAQLRIEKEKVNLLVGAITDEITLKEDRATLLKELQQEYPGFLKNLKTETVTNKELTDRLKDVNKEYEKKINIAIKEALMAEHANELAKLWSKQKKKQDKLEETQAYQKAAIERGASQGIIDSYQTAIDKIKGKIKGLQDERKEIDANVVAIMLLVEAEKKLLDTETGGGDGGGKPTPKGPTPKEPILKTRAEIPVDTIFQMSESAAENLANSASMYLDVLEQMKADEIAIEEETARKIKAIQESIKQRKISDLQQYLSLTSDFAGAIGNMWESQKEKELSAVGDNAKKREAIEKKYANREKAIALGQAAINTALAVTKVLGQTGVLSPFVIPLILATGAIQMAAIASQSFEEGGVVPPGYPNDNYPALLSSGERVTPPEKLPISSNSNRLGNQNVKFIIEKDQLVGVLEMYNNQKNNF